MFNQLSFTAIKIVLTYSKRARRMLQQFERNKAHRIQVVLTRKCLSFRAAVLCRIMKILVSSCNLFPLLDVREIESSYEKLSRHDS